MIFSHLYIINHKIYNMSMTLTTVPREQSNKTILNVRVSEETFNRFHKYWYYYKAKNPEDDQDKFLSKMLDKIKDEVNPSLIY